MTKSEIDNTTYNVVDNTKMVIIALKALCYMLLTNFVPKIFFCNIRKDGGKQPPSILLMLPFTTEQAFLRLHFSEVISEVKFCL